MIHVIAAICGWPEALLFLRIVQRHLPPSLYTSWCLHQEMYLQVMELSIRWVCLEKPVWQLFKGKVREKCKCEGNCSPGWGGGMPADEHRIAD